MARLILQLSSILLFVSTATLAAPSAIAAVSTLQQLSRRDSTNSARCRCFPGDACWPTASVWNAFNQSLGGKLVATIPIGSLCHVDSFAPYDAQKCSDLQGSWNDPATHYPSSSSIMAPFFANRSCDPFTPKNTQCIIGTYVQYAVKASGPSDYQKTLAFVKKHNIRLTIRNTGHDYNGKATGAGAVAIWTHHIKSIEFITYQSPAYTGKAVKMGAGVQVFEVTKAGKDNGFIVVGGDCPTVGVAGGYTQGGGHGPLASTFGLAADQVLEWEVVTASGQLLTASATQNSDLYWALSGGGGGTYGVVLSLTSKVYADRPTAAANLTFTNEGVSQEAFYNAVEVFINNQLALVDAGAVSIWLLSNGSLALTPTTAPGLKAAQLTKLFTPTLTTLNQSGIKYTYVALDFPTYLDSYNAMNPPNPVSVFQIGGRLIPRSLSNNPALKSALQFIVEQGALVSGVTFSVPEKAGSPANSVNPEWRTTLFDAVLGTFWSGTDWSLNLANQQLMTNVLLPRLERLTPNGAAYLNEADFQQPGFQDVFYGTNYRELNAIKDKYDPDHIFYALTAVGSKYWTEEADGRLCASYESEQ